jgi:hypothetical protein
MVGGKRAGSRPSILIELGKLRIEAQEEHERQNHQFRVEQDEDASVVEAPFAAEAAGCLNHAPRSDEGHKNLPTRTMERVDVRESGESEAECEGAEGECDAADE